MISQFLSRVATTHFGVPSVCISCLLLFCGCPRVESVDQNSARQLENPAELGTELDTVQDAADQNEDLAAEALMALGRDDDERRGIVKRDGEDHVVAIDLSRVGARVQEFIHLGQLPHLERLTASVEESDGTALRHIAKLDRLRELKLRGPSITDDEWNSLDELAALQVLSLQDTSVTDEGLRSLGKFQNLQNLTLFRMAITSDGLEPISQLKKLKRLNLRGTAVDDEGLRHLQNLSALRILDLSETQVGDAGVEHLRELALQDLNLWATRVGDKGMPHLGQIRSLKRLNLDNIGDPGQGIVLSSDGVRHLAPLENLEWMHLGKTQIGDSGLTALTGLSSLQELIITFCPNVTDAAVEELQRALPKLSIKR